MGLSPARIFVRVEGEGGGRRYGRTERDRGEGPLKVTFVHLDNTVALLSRLNPERFEFYSEPWAGFQPTSQRGGRKQFHNIYRVNDLPEHCECLH